MLQQLMISKSEIIFESGHPVNTYLECQMEKTLNPFKIFLNHPERIFLNGSWYQKTGWNSDKEIVYYKRVK